MSNIQEYEDIVDVVDTTEDASEVEISLAAIRTIQNPETRLSVIHQLRIALAREVEIIETEEL